VEAGPGVTQAACTFSDPQKWVLTFNAALWKKHVVPSNIFTYLFDWVKIITLRSLLLRLWLKWCIRCLSFSFKPVRDGIVLWNILAGCNINHIKSSVFCDITPCSRWILVLLFHRPWRWRHCVPTKRLQRTTRLYTPEDRTLHNHCCEKLKSYMSLARRPLFGLLYQPWMVEDDECGAVGGIRIGRGNRSTRRKPASVPVFSPEIPYELT
jgi:hypothetical protein